jgi:archaellum component FlaG (FlaF/FlaG flagellin family)
MERFTMPAAPRTVRTALLVILAASVLGVIFMSWSSLSEMMRLPRSESSAKVTETKTTAVDIVVEVNALDRRGQVSAVLLVPGTAPASYIRTKTPIQIMPDRSIQYVMGSQSDLVNGAVIDVRGTRQSISPLTILADRVVVLSGNVTVR